MHDILRQIHAADDAGLYYMVLFGTLTLPDICGALETPNEPNGDRYKRWYNENVIPSFTVLTADECWKYRCSILHEGASQHERFERFDRIAFIEPTPGVPRPMMNMPNQASAGGGVIGSFTLDFGTGTVSSEQLHLLKTQSGETVLPIDIQLFYIEVTTAVGRWLEQIKDPAILTRLDEMIRSRPGRDAGGMALLQGINHPDFSGIAGCNVIF